jgi:hypothetical protein
MQSSLFVCIFIVQPQLLYTSQVSDDRTLHSQCEQKGICDREVLFMYFSPNSYSDVAGLYNVELKHLGKKYPDLQHFCGSRRPHSSEASNGLNCPRSLMNVYIMTFQDFIRENNMVVECMGRYSAN